MILCAMGWQDSHLHSFTVKHPRTSRNVEISQKSDFGYHNEFDESEGEDKEILSTYFSLGNPKGTFLYDFGDNWEHVILLEKVEPKDPTQTYPQCIVGKRACPPEDCGGVGDFRMPCQS